MAGCGTSGSGDAQVLVEVGGGDVGVRQMEALGVRIVPGLPGDEAATGADVAVQGGQD